jgi:hypothetical protein
VNTNGIACGAYLQPRYGNFIEEEHVVKDRRINAAFATGNKKQVDAGFELATQIAVYEIGATEAKELDVIAYRSATQKAAESATIHGQIGTRGDGCCGGGGKGKGDGSGKGKKAGGSCGDSKQEDAFNQQEIAEKVASLAGVSVLFVNKTLNAYSVIKLGEARIFTVKVDNPENISDVITRLQEMLAGDPPLWLRRHLIGADAEIAE